MRTTYAALTTAALLAAAPAFAEPFILDKSHAHVKFSVDHLGFSQTIGHFRDFDAEINFDPTDIEAAQVRFVIEAASIDTFWEARDEHIRGADFLDVANHPEIVFASTDVVQTGDETAQITGDLTIRGVTKPIIFQAELNKIGPSPFDPAKTVAGFVVTGVIDRTEFGITYAAPAVGVEIPVEIHLEMSPASAS
ncbi:MAG: YceI family protein [Pikeienuella sp.]